MSFHIGAGTDEIAPVVLLAGDPLRAKFAADHFLENVTCYNQVRGMLGYTGRFRGIPISVQGSGMGIPSTAIYARELLIDYKARRLIRIGTCGALQPDIKINDMVIASYAYTDSSVPQLLAPQSPPSLADPKLLQSAQQKAELNAMNIEVGPLFSTDLFYHPQDPSRWLAWQEKGVLGVEMETAVLYLLARQHRAEALTICTVSDHILNGQVASSEQRERGLGRMIQLALEVGIDI